MSFKQLLKKIGKHLLAGFFGAIIGLIISLIYLFKIWFPINSDKIGLAIVVFIPIMVILFSIIGILIGGILGIVISLLVKLLRKK